MTLRIRLSLRLRYHVEDLSERLGLLDADPPGFFANEAKKLLYFSFSALTSSGSPPVGVLGVSDSNDGVASRFCLQI